MRRNRRSEPKVAEHTVKLIRSGVAAWVAFAQHEILWLDVPVHNTETMNIRQRTAELPNQGRGVRFTERRAFAHNRLKDLAPACEIEQECPGVPVRPTVNQPSHTPAVLVQSQTYTKTGTGNTRSKRVLAFCSGHGGSAFSRSRTTCDRWRAHMSLNSWAESVQFSSPLRAAGPDCGHVAFPPTASRTIVVVTGHGVARESWVIGGCPDQSGRTFSAHRRCRGRAETRDKKLKLK